jgi:1-phosphofructokinase family hexose kinase
MKIITLTLNPAFDLHCFAKNFAPYRESLADITATEAGGKGVNISRALTANGVESTALVVLGDENGDAFRRALAADGIDCLPIVQRGRIRENITLHTEGAPETRISFRGFSADASLLNRVADLLDAKLTPDTVVTFTGSLPSGVGVAHAKRMLLAMKEKGAKIVIDSRSFGLDDIREVRPWLIKPNEEEIPLYSAQPVTDLASAADAARELRGEASENVMISLGGAGAVLATADGVFAASAPSIEVRSTVGAGDSAIAGFLAAANEGLPYPEMLRRAVCFGSAACMTEGTRPPSGAAVAALEKDVKVWRIGT